jgi:Ala-tRNA(Pro) deacylase
MEVGMTAASSVQLHLDRHSIEFDTLAHIPTVSSMRAAKAAGVSGDKMVRAVVLKKLQQKERYLLAVVPASHRLHRLELQALLDEPIDLALEEELTRLFPDCELGAVPPLGEAYGIETFVDDSVSEQPDVYFEGGDHVTLVHVTGPAFCSLMTNAMHGKFSSHR